MFFCVESVKGVAICSASSSQSSRLKCCGRRSLNLSGRIRKVLFVGSTPAELALDCGKFFSVLLSFLRFPE